MNTMTEDQIKKALVRNVAIFVGVKIALTIGTRLAVKSIQKNL